MTTLETLIAAIKDRRVITFTYSGIARTAEPHAVGVSRTGKDVLRCYQTKGGHVKPGHEWDFCSLSKIVGLTMTESFFEGVRDGYERDDKHMRRIYVQL